MLYILIYNQIKMYKGKYMFVNENRRKVPKNYSNITGKISSSKSKSLISYESKLERDFAYIFDFDKDIELIIDQPVTIEFYINGIKRKYTPDFYIKRKNNNDLLIEVKYYDDLKKNLLVLKDKFIAAKKYSKINNLEFKIFTNLCPLIKNKDYLFNVHFLLSYPNVNFKTYKLIYSHYQINNTIRQLLEEITKDKYEQLNYIHPIWALVRYHIIELDLNKKLNIKMNIDNFKKLTKPQFEEICNKEISQ